jgi:uncharacterized protein YbaA (DUF1428 family)
LVGLDDDPPSGELVDVQVTVDGADADEVGLVRWIEHTEDHLEDHFHGFVVAAVVSE